MLNKKKKPVIYISCGTCQTVYVNKHFSCSLTEEFPKGTFPRRDNYEMVNIHWRFKKNKPSPEQLGQFQSNLAHIILGWRGILDYWNEGPLLFPRGHDYEIVKIHWLNLKIFFYRPTGPITTKLRKTNLGKKDMRLLKWKGHSSFHLEIITKLQKNFNEIKKYSPPEQLDQFYYIYDHYFARI